MSKFDYVVAPGEYVEEWLEDMGWTQANLARHLDCSRKHVSELIAGRVALTPDYARRLERVTGTPADRWMQIETFYRSELERLELERDPAAAKAILQKFPLKVLREQGYLTATLRQPARCATQVMSFYRAGNLSALDGLHASAAKAVAFRQSASLDGIARATWLRLVELDAAECEVDVEFDRSKLEALIPALRALTRETPADFGRQIVDGLASVGVQIVFTAAVPRAGTYGAARWFDGKPLVALSLHRRTEDQFWFTLFHELYHVMRHTLTPEGFVSGDWDDGKQEQDANDYAGELLIPAEHAARLRELKTPDEVREFAVDIDIAPGIVVARLRRDGYWDYTQGHSLVRRLRLVKSDD